MGKRRWRRSDDGAGRLIVHTDGAIRPGATGLGVVVRDRVGRVVAWRSRRLPRAMTCNEAEYEALLLGLETVRALRLERVEMRTDSQIVVNQMRGVFSVRSTALRRLHERARAAVAALSAVEFVHVPRRRNRLADALANEAVDGMIVEGRSNPKSQIPNPKSKITNDK